MIEACSSRSDVKRIVTGSSERPVFLLKHSPRCGVSAHANSHFSQFAESEPRAAFHSVDVVGERRLARHIAKATGIPHESPQVILFHDGRAVWNASHYNISADSLAQALAAVLADSTTAESNS